MNDVPLAYLLTWTCYGTWLHGDARGSVDREHNQPHAPYVNPDPRRVVRETTQLHYSPLLLDSAARQIVCQTIERHCRIRNWELIATNVRTNHVHAVVAARVCRGGPVPMTGVLSEPEVRATVTSGPDVQATAPAPVGTRGANEGASAECICSKRMLRELKAWATRRLREAGRVPQDHPVWTEDGSRRFLWTLESISEAVEYVQDRQGENLD